MSKTRNLSIFEYFNKLQEEYIVAELRKKIYPSNKDKNYYMKVMQGKRAAIEDIAMRNQLPSMFTCNDIATKHYQNIYGDSGFPKFLYKDSEEKRELEWKDWNNYYTKNQFFKTLVDGTVYVGELIEINISKNECELRIENSDKCILTEIDKISRIL